MTPTSALETMTSAALREKCPYCGEPTHPALCPRVKRIEYHDNGNIKSLEFYAAWEMQAAPIYPNYFIPSLQPTYPNPLQPTWNPIVTTTTTGTVSNF